MLLDKIQEFNIPLVDTILPFTKIDSLIEFTRGLENAEGFVLALADGHRVKIKADQYVRIHKTIDRIVFDRNIVNLIINEEVDDVIPMLPSVQVERIREFELRFWRAFVSTEDRLAVYRTGCELMYQNDRKRIATEFVPTMEHKTDAQFIFCMLDGHDLRELLLQHIAKNITTNVKWDACAKWLGM
jgi:hypothetical protein